MCLILCQLEWHTQGSVVLTYHTFFNHLQIWIKKKTYTVGWQICASLVVMALLGESLLPQWEPTWSPGISSWSPGFAADHVSVQSPKPCQYKHHWDELGLKQVLVPHPHSVGLMLGTIGHRELVVTHLFVSMAADRSIFLKKINKIQHQSHDSPSGFPTLLPPPPSMTWPGASPS